MGRPRRPATVPVATPTLGRSAASRSAASRSAASRSAASRSAASRSAASRSTLNHGAAGCVIPPAATVHISAVSTPALLAGADLSVTNAAWRPHAWRSRSRALGTDGAGAGAIPTRSSGAGPPRLVVAIGAGGASLRRGLTSPADAGRGVAPGSVGPKAVAKSPSGRRGAAAPSVTGAGASLGCAAAETGRLRTAAPGRRGARPQIPARTGVTSARTSTTPGIALVGVGTRLARPGLAPRCALVSTAILPPLAAGTSCPWPLTGRAPAWTRRRRHLAIVRDRLRRPAGPGPCQRGGARTRQTPAVGRGPVSRLFRRRPTLPGGNPPSTIGAGGLNFRVRDGNGCDSAAMATGNLALTAGGRR